MPPNSGRIGRRELLPTPSLEWTGGVAAPTIREIDLTDAILIQAGNQRFKTTQSEDDTVGAVACRRIRSHIVNGHLKPDGKLELDRHKRA